MELCKQFPSDVNMEMKQLFENSNFEEKIRLVYSLNNVAVSIKKLESNDLSTEDQIKILLSTQNGLSDYPELSERLFKILEKNPNLKFFKEYNMVKCKETDKCLSFISLTTVEVERSFSQYRDVLDDKRTRLTVQNIEKHLFIQYNTKK